MWTTRSRKEEKSFCLQCIAFGTACMALLTAMTVWL